MIYLLVELLFTCSGQWDAAIVDAEEVHVALPSHIWVLTPFYTQSIKIQRSVIGYIAKCLALVGNGGKTRD